LSQPTVHNKAAAAIFAHCQLLSGSWWRVNEIMAVIVKALAAHTQGSRNKWLAQ